MTGPPLTIADLFERNRTFADSDREDAGLEHDPSFVSVSCCDARVPQNDIFGDRAGENFSVARIGNIVTGRGATGDEILAGSVVYPLVKNNPICTIIIGHTDCGAVTAAYDQVVNDAPPDRPEIQAELELLLPIIDEGTSHIDDDQSRDEQITRLVEYNVDAQVDRLLEYDANLPVVGVVCDLHGYYGETTGVCHLVNYDGRRRKSDLPEPLREFFCRQRSSH